MNDVRGKHIQKQVKIENLIAYTASLGLPCKLFWSIENHYYASCCSFFLQCEFFVYFNAILVCQFRNKSELNLYK